MHIDLLIYNHALRFPPTIHLANILAERGHKVRIWQVYDPGDISAQWHDPKVEFKSLYQRCKGLKLRLQYILSVFKLVFQSRSDWLITYDAPSVIPARITQVLTGRKWWYHQHDFWENPVNILQKLQYKSEYRWVRYANGISFPQQQRADHFFRKAKLQSTPLIVHNCPRLIHETFIPSEKPELVQRILSDHPYFIVYQGGVSDQFGLDKTIQMLRYTEGEIALMIIGEDRQAGFKEKLKQLCVDLKVAQYVYFSDNYIPYDELSTFSSYATFGLSILSDIEENIPFNIRYLTGASNKIGEYAALGLPVLFNDNMVNREFLREYPIGITVPASDPIQYAECVLELLNRPEELGNLKRSCLQSSRSSLNFDKQVHKLIEQIERN